MAEMTTSSMHDARDAEDTRLLEHGQFAELLAAYFHPVRERCYLRLRDQDAADEVAQRVFLRIYAELQRGKRYPVPFRVVVWMVVEWSIKGFYAGAKEGASLPDGWEAALPDAYAEWESNHDLSVLFADLPPGEQAVARAIYLEGLSIEQAASKLGKERNAVDQALWRAHKKLAERLSA
jgi:RNA polymerase sigma factor (sigma-70 family)